MPTIQSNTHKYYSQLVNGEDFSLNIADFTPNLVSNIENKVKLVAQIDITWGASSNSVDTWNMFAGPAKIVKTLGSFKDEGISAGNVLDFFNADNLDIAIIQVDSISSDGLTMFYTVISGSVTVTTNQSEVTLTARSDYLENYLTALVYQYGLIPNDSDFSISSRITGSEQSLYADSIGVDMVRDTDFVDMLPQGTVRDWVSGTVKVKYDSNPDDNTQRFIIEQEIVIPWYRAEEASNITNQIPTGEFAGDNTLKHSIGTDFRFTLSDPNTAKVNIENDNLGSVGWFNENFNGLGNNYQVNSIVYSNNEALSLSESVTVVLEIEKTALLIPIPIPVVLSVSIFPSEENYVGTTTTLLENFLFDSVVNDSGVPKDGSLTISNMTVAVSAGKIQVTATIDFTGQIVPNGSDYLISVSIQDPLLPNQTADRVNLIVDSRDFVVQSNLTDLFTAQSIQFIDHDQLPALGLPMVTAWNEDVLIANIDFRLDLAKEAFLNSLTFEVVAVDGSGNEFSLDSFIIDTSGFVVSEGFQQINFTRSRGYNLNTDDPFNTIRCLPTGGSPNVTQDYSIKFPQRINWKSWVQNLQADPVFYDNTKPNNNLNLKSSNYSDLEGYDIKLKITGNLSGINSIGSAESGDVPVFSETIIVNDYDKDQNITPLLIGTTETFTKDGVNNLGGGILTDDFTLFRITWASITPPISSITGVWAINRIEPGGNLGDPWELSSVRESTRSQNPLVPLLGQNKLKVSLVGGEIICECLIDPSKLNQNAKHNLDGRVQK